MLLAVDIGNTNVTFGLFKGRRLIKRRSVPTRELVDENRDRYLFVCPYLETIVICSVVPRVEQLLVPILQRLFKKKPVVLGKDIKVPIKNLYRKPGQVGQDRLVNAYAGYTLYKAPIIIVDFGTAVTFDVVSKTGAYLGGIIAPGIELSLNALSEKTALLPKIKLKRVSSVLGKTTAHSMASGILYGFASMCDGLVARLNKKLGLKFNVIATGGNAHLISKYSSSIRRLDENLTLKGINLIFQKIKKNT